MRTQGYLHGILLYNVLSTTKIYLIGNNNMEYKPCHNNCSTTTGEIRISTVYTLLIYVYIAIDNTNDMFLLKHEYKQSTYIKVKWPKKWLE